MMHKLVEHARLLICIILDLYYAEYSMKCVQFLSKVKYVFDSFTLVESAMKRVVLTHCQYENYFLLRNNG